MSRVVNHDLVKAALVLSAVDPSAGGACVYGRRGTCKTVLARATHALLPDHDVVPGSYANADPDAGPREWETGLLERLADEAKRLLAKGSSTPLEPPDSAAASASNVEPSSQNLRLARRLDTLAPSLFRATRAPPFVTVPLSATEDMCVGTWTSRRARNRVPLVSSPGASRAPTAASSTSTSSTSWTMRS